MCLMYLFHVNRNLVTKEVNSSTVTPSHISFLYLFQCNQYTASRLKIVRQAPQAVVTMLSEGGFELPLLG